MSKKPYRKDKSKGKSHQNPRNIMRLCGQVAKAIEFALAGGCNNDILRNLYVVKVVPNPDTSRMLVVVSQHCPDETPPSVIIQTLSGYQSILRQEVAESINRRRTPSFAFTVVHEPMEEEIKAELTN